MARDEAYRIAELRIDQAKRTRSENLILGALSVPGDMQSPQLTELPESLVRLSWLRRLTIFEGELTFLPEWLGQLKELRELGIVGGQINSLPRSLGQLTQLRKIQLSDNQFVTAPDLLRNFTNIESLVLNGNPIEELPEWFGQFNQLKHLAIGSMRLKAIPNWIGNLGKLTNLYIQNNPLHQLPEALFDLVKLKVLNLNSIPVNNIQHQIEKLEKLEKLENLMLENNGISDLPWSLIKLKNLIKLDLDKNPLNTELAAAYREGLSSVKRYLRELEKGSKKRYEAKLLILGDGNEGKTCVSRALRGLSFRKQNTTRGVDVVQWKFPHPDDPENRGKDVTLNVWDFEGQEISHQTHQFFLTSQSLYLLVFKCRDQFLMDRAEYWLDTIRARAPHAKVAIVISQCEGRSPLVPLDRIQQQYGNLLAKEWFFAVGCQDGTNVSKLKTFLQRWAVGLEFIGNPWPTSYGNAEMEIKGKAKTRMSQITREKLNRIFEKAGVSEDNYDDAAAAMSRLGLITQFPDCPELRDFIILRPQWLTKAISKVMEDRKLSEDKGEIALQRMEAMWRKTYPGMFATFHGCMKEFELCYDLEDDSQSCLLPLRFGYLRPEIPWSNIVGHKERRVEYKLSIRPPMGIMSRFIVKTHHLIVKTPTHPKGIFWHNGVFLHTGEGPLRSEALCEFVPEERKFCLQVRAAYPQNMCEQIHAYVKAVFSFFEGLEAERSYGCIRANFETGIETKCNGIHTEKRIYAAISKRRPMIDCEFEDHEVDPRLLVGGFSSFSEFVMAKVVSIAELRRELDMQPGWAIPFLRSVESLLEWVTTNEMRIDQLVQGQSVLSAEFKQEAELKLHEYLALTSQMLDDREATAAPGLLSISTKDRSKWNPAGYFKKTYIITPYCECTGNIHPCADGRVEFTRDKEWWGRTAPWVARGTKLLSAGLLLAFAGMPLVMGSEVFDTIKDDVKFMEELAKHLELQAGVQNSMFELEVASEFEEIGTPSGLAQARLMRVAFSRLLEDVAPTNYNARQWGSLRRFRMSDNSYRWLCEDCAKRGR